MGRTSFRRPKRDHEGQRADPTAFAALKAAAAGGEKKPPTDLEKKLLFDDNRSTVSALKGAGMSDEKIYEIINEAANRQ